MNEAMFRNLDELDAFRKLVDSDKRNLKTLLTAERVRRCSIPITSGSSVNAPAEGYYNYAAMPADEKILDLLEELASESRLIEKYQAVLTGEIMNTGEKRMVLHHLTRGFPAGKPVIHKGNDLRQFYQGERKKMETFVKAVHEGSVTGSTGKPFRRAVQIGIGGSDLGPRAMYLALKGISRQRKRIFMEASFISNVDPDDAADVLEGIDPEETLFILVSKSGTTQETLANRELVLGWMRDSQVSGLDPAKHMVAITSATSPLAASREYLESFYIDDFIGGRYSSTSAVGGVILSLAFGSEIFEEFLQGAAGADKAALEPDIRKNAALMDALLGVYCRNILDLPAAAILPYSQALSRFPAHLQQLEMESNGKQVNRAGKPVSYATGPVVFGEPGTNGQHSFYQLLHQGSDIVPLQFIGFTGSQRGIDTETDGSTNQVKLNANLAAQIIAFAKGKDDSNPNKQFSGERPSSLIHGKLLTPAVLGAILAHFENKVMFQGFLWNLNSFDQEGVQLGKVLTGQVLSGVGKDDALAAYADLLINA